MGLQFVSLIAAALHTALGATSCSGPGCRSEPDSNVMLQVKAGTELRRKPAMVLYKEDFETLAEGTEWCPMRHDTDSSCKVASECPGEEQCTGNNVRVAYAPTDRGSDRLRTNAKLSASVTTATLSYDLYFEPTFQWVKGGKLGAGFFGGQGTTGCKPIVPDGWSFRLMWRYHGELIMYLYHQNRKRRCGDNVYAKVASGQRFRFKKGQWYNIRLDMKLNKIGESDGRAELFVDDVSLATMEDIEWRKQGALISRFGFSSFYGGSKKTWAPNATTYIRYDNFRVETTDKLPSAPVTAAPVAYCSNGVRDGKKRNGKRCCPKACADAVADGERACGGSGCGSRVKGKVCCTGSTKKKTCKTAEDVSCTIP